MPSSFHTTHIELVSEHLLFSPTLTTYPLPFFSVFCFLPFLVPSRLMYYILFACAGLSSALPLRDPCERHGPSCASCHEITAGYNPLPATLLGHTFLYYSHLLQGARRVLKTILIRCAAVAFGCVLDSTRNGGLTPETCTRQEASPCCPCFTIDRLRPLDSLHVTSASNYAVSMASCSPQAGVLLSIEQSFDWVTESDGKRERLGMT